MKYQWKYRAGYKTIMAVKPKTEEHMIVVYQPNTSRMCIYRHKEGGKVTHASNVTEEHKIDGYIEKLAEEFGMVVLEEEI